MEGKLALELWAFLTQAHPVNKTGSAISTLCDCAWSPVQAAAHTEIKWAQRCQEWNKDGIKPVPFFYPDHVCVLCLTCVMVWVLEKVGVVSLSGTHVLDTTHCYISSWFASSAEFVPLKPAAEMIWTFGSRRCMCERLLPGFIPIPISQLCNFSNWPFRNTV